MIHAISLQKEGLEAAVELLSQVVYKPIFSQSEMEYTQQAIAFELENLDMNPNKEFIMMEMIHAVSMMRCDSDCLTERCCSVI